VAVVVGFVFSHGPLRLDSCRCRCTLHSGESGAPKRRRSLADSTQRGCGMAVGCTVMLGLGQRNVTRYDLVNQIAIPDNTYIESGFTNNR